MANVGDTVVLELASCGTTSAKLSLAIKIGIATAGVNCTAGVISEPTTSDAPFMTPERWSTVKTLVVPAVGKMDTESVLNDVLTVLTDFVTTLNRIIAASTRVNVSDVIWLLLLNFQGPC